MKKYATRCMTLAAALGFIFLVAAARAVSAADPPPLVFLHYWTGPLAGGVREMTGAYNAAHPDHAIRATGFEHESYKIGIQVMLSAGNPPDIFSYWAGAKVQALVDAGYLAPIDDLWRTAGLDAKFPETVAKACEYDGRKYVIPVTQHYVCFFYNTKIFHKLGLTAPGTWKEFLDACAALKAAGVTPLALGARDKWPAQFWFDYLLLRTAGPAYRDRLLSGKASFEDPQVKRVMGLWRSLLEAGYFNDAPGAYDWSEAARMTAGGDAAMTLMGTWIIGLYDGQMGLNGQGYGYFPFPVLDEDVQEGALGPIDVIALPKGDKAEFAKTALLYFTEKGPQEAMSRGSGALAPSLSVPGDFYPPMQRGLLELARRASSWSFNFDLATPPGLSEAGLEAFTRFLAAPNEADAILSGLEARARIVFAGKPLP